MVVNGKIIGNDVILKLLLGSFFDLVFRGVVELSAVSVQFQQQAGRVDADSY